MLTPHENNLFVLRELDYRLEKNLWCFTENRIVVRFEYESHDAEGQWWRSHGNELCEYLTLGATPEEIRRAYRRYGARFEVDGEGILTLRLTLHPENSS